MIDYNIEFTKGVLFIRFFGVLNRFSEKDIENEIINIIKEGGIRYLVFNIEELEIEEDVSIFKLCESIVKDNDGKMLICTESEFFVDDFECVPDELSALKLLSV